MNAAKSSNGQVTPLLHHGDANGDGGEEGNGQRDDGANRGRKFRDDACGTNGKGGSASHVVIHQDDTQVVKIRSILFSNAFTALMIMALLTALFLPDLWVLSGIDSNLELDVILTMVMILFAVEMIGLMALDRAYTLSFFHMMDIIGTVSMIFDVSYLLGVDVTMAQISEQHGNTNLMVLGRTLRAARAGARAGRLSRVLRIFKVIPCNRDNANMEKRAKGIAVVISGQLSNLLATRVACLSISLVMVIPLFDVLSFPQADYALQTWVDRISISVQEDSMAKAIKELNQMVDFFGRHSYGPYSVCKGFMEGDSFICKETIEGWSPRYGEPVRGASSLMVRSDSVMVAFNMHGPICVDAALSILNVFFIVCIMVFSGLALSNVVTELTVRPLERMLLTVRQIASTVFKFSANVTEDAEEEDPTDIDSASEMILLEKVVQKLAVIADLQTREDSANIVTDDMQDEDVGILSLMQGRDLQKAGEKTQKAAVVFRSGGKRGTPLKIKKEEDFPITQEEYHSWAFNPLPWSANQRVSLVVFTISVFHDAGEGFVRNADDKATLQRFVAAAESMYQPVPFHSFAHAVDTTHSTARMMRLIQSENFLSDLEQFSLLISAVAHDVGHPGLNNGFLSETSHELALQYNDQSPLENMHCAKLYSIIAKEETNVLAKLPKEQYKEVRKNCIEVILHTDMVKHQEMVKDLQMAYQMNSEVFNANANGPMNSDEIEVFSKPETKTLIMDMILHSADVSNPCRAWEVTQAWAVQCLEEFFQQGDREKSMGIPVQFLNDREKLNRPNSQIGFIEFMIAPLFMAEIRLWPKLHEYGDNLAHNLCCWETLWVQESAPSEEEKTKVRARIEKAKMGLETAKGRA